MSFTHALSTNNYGARKLIVATSAANGTHTTLASAMSAASVGDTIEIRDSVTENVTITPGVNITGPTGQAALNNPSITGTLTMTGAGTSTVSNIRLVTNSAPFITVSGSAASILNVINCYLNCSNNTGISFSSSSASAQILINNCRGNIGTTGIGLHSSSSAGTLLIEQTVMTNTGSTVTASTHSAGIVSMLYSRLPIPFSSSGTGEFGTISFTIIDTSDTNTASLTHNGTSNCTISYSYLASGTASALSIGAGAGVQSNDTVYRSTNSNVVTGAGSLTFSKNTYFNSVSNNVTTQVAIWTDMPKWQATKQPAFLATQTTAQDNLPINTTTTFTINNEIFDQGADYNAGTYTFTAPITGRYFLSYMVRLNNSDTATASYDFQLVTSNRTYSNTSQIQLEVTADAISCRSVTALADMDAGDTALCRISIANSGASQADVQVDSGATTFTNFSGILLA